MKKMDNLARDMLAAKAAGYGCDYGRYIADRGHTSKPQPKKIEKKTGVCALCGAEYIMRDKWPSKYCSSTCQDEAHRRQQAVAREKRRERKAKESDCAASLG